MITERDITVRFQKRAHNPLLMAAGFAQTDQPVPWLGKKKLRSSSGSRGVYSSTNASIAWPPGRSDVKPTQYHGVPG